MPQRLFSAMLPIAVVLGLGCGASGPGASADTGVVSTTDAADVDPTADMVQVADQDTGTQGDADPAALACERTCETQQKVECPVTRECLSPCLREINGRCKNRQRVVISCLQNATVADYFCGSDNYVEPKPETCTAEVDAFVKCAETGIDPP